MNFLLLLLTIQAAVATPQHNNALSTLQRSLPNSYLINGKLINKVELLAPCQTRVIAQGNVVDIDWTKVQPLYRTTDWSRTITLGDHVLATSEVRTAERVEAAADNLTAICQPLE